ncbi:hypothetical protein ACP275_04G181300 [Erythranthe tilingii]
MHRLSSSYSAAKASNDEFSVNFLPDASKDLVSDDFSDNYNNNSNNNNYNPISDDIAKKDISPKPYSGERAIHLIPLILIMCGLVLWIFSNPVDLH